VLARPHEDALRTESIAVVLALRAWVHLQLTVPSRPPRCTRALVRVDHVRACAAVHARRRLALIRVDLAVVPAVPVTTHATVRKSMVEAGAAIDARHRRALVQLREACADWHIRVTGSASAGV